MSAEWRKRIKALRKVKGITLMEVAKELNVTEATAQRYESGKIKYIPYESVYKYARLFNCSPSYIIGWEEEQTAELSSKESDLLNRFNNLSEEKQDCILHLMDLLSKKE